MKQAWLMRKTRKILKISRGTLRIAMLRCERLEDPTKMSYGHLVVNYYERINKLVKLWNHWSNIFGKITHMFPLIKEML